jgi:hypothetical protein
VATLAKRLLQQQIEEADHQIAHLKLRIEQQIVQLDELAQRPHEVLGQLWIAGSENYHCSNNNASISIRSLRWLAG